VIVGMDNPVDGSFIALSSGEKMDMGSYVDKLLNMTNEVAQTVAIQKGNTVFAPAPDADNANDGQEFSEMELLLAYVSQTKVKNSRPSKAGQEYIQDQVIRALSGSEAGAGITATIGSGENVEIAVPAGKTVLGFYVDLVKAPETAYTVEGQTLTLTSAFVDTLTVGQHNAVLELEGDLIPMTLTVKEKGAAPALMLGDANLDKTLDFKDAIAMLEHYVEIKLLSAEVEAVCDLAEDGIVDFKDAIYILEVYVEMRPNPNLN